MQTTSNALVSFLLKIYESIRQRKIRHALQHYGFRRGLIALSLGFLICVLVCKTCTMQPISCAFRKRHSRIADTCEMYFILATCRGVMSGSESVPHRKALKRCMLFRQFCEAHMHRNPAKQSSLAKAASISVAYTLLSGGASSLSYSDAAQNITAKNFIHLT